MRYSNAGEIIVMTIVWVVVLLAIDKALNQPAEEAQSTQQQVHMEFPQPQVAMMIRHVGCSDQYKEVERALQTLPWLGTIQVKRGESLAQAEGTPQKVVPMPEGVEAIQPEQPEELCAVRILAARSADTRSGRTRHAAGRAMNPHPALTGGVREDA